MPSGNVLSYIVPMRDHIHLQINSDIIKVRGHDAFLTLSEFLRRRRGLVGTKIVCSEGDCGSCSVLCGQVTGDGMRYQPVDSCIRFMFQLDGVHIVTVEGLKQDGELSCVQQAMVDCHGSQCGFCTPGFVVAMTALRQNRPASQPATESELREGLTGNLCRCTGYSSILEAGAVAAEQSDTASLVPAFELSPDALRVPIEVTATCGDAKHHVYSPTTVAEAVDFLSRHSEAEVKIVAGATDLGVQFNKGHIAPSDWMDLNRVAELEKCEIVDGFMVFGARATWTDVLLLAESTVPELYQVMKVFGSPQIRHVGTIGGNIINASPIADSLPFLFVCDAELTITGAAGVRTVNINDFYSGYKQMDLAKGELLTSIRVPLPPANRNLRLYKVSRRRDLDISTFTGAIWMELDGEKIADAGIAYGAVGPTVLRLKQTEEFLRGKSFTIETMTAAGDVAVKEIMPITDVRGRSGYRFQLARNVLKKFYYQQGSGLKQV